MPDAASPPPSPPPPPEAEAPQSALPPTGPDGAAILHGMAMALVAAFPLVVIAANLPPEWGWPGNLLGFLLLALIPLAGMSGARLPAARWKAVGAIAGVIGGAIFGYQMERVTGALIGIPAGAVGMALLSMFGYRLPNWLPRRTGAVLGWGLLASAGFVLPLLVMLRLAFGRLDDDDWTFVFFATFLGCARANEQRWFARPAPTWPVVRGLLRDYLRRLLDPRLLPWFAAVLIGGLILGPLGGDYLVRTAPDLLIAPTTTQFLWPILLLLGAGLSVRAAWRGPSLTIWNGGLLVVGTIFCCLMLAHLWNLGWERAAVGDTRLAIRHNVWRVTTVERGELVGVEAQRVSGRRFVRHDPVLVLRDGSRITLRGFPHSHEVSNYLRDHWAVPVE